MGSFHVVFRPLPSIQIDARAQHAGTVAASRALTPLGNAWLARLQPLAFYRRDELDGVKYLDSSVLEYALYKALEAAFPVTCGDPPPPLTRDSFVLRIVSEEN